MDRPRSSNSSSTTPNTGGGGGGGCEAMEDSNSEWGADPLASPPPHLLPKAKNATSQRLEFTGKPILNASSGRHVPSKQRLRRLSGHYTRGSDIAGNPVSPLDMTSDFARSCPDRDSISRVGLMSELMSAVDLISARQNQWVSSNDARSTIQVLKAAQSSTLLFVRKSIDEGDEDPAARPKDVRYFDEDSACSMFFRHSTCYDVLPESGKLLVLDSALPIRRAMQALIDHSLHAAPVWCSRLQCYTQLLTTDLCLRLLGQAFPLLHDTASKVTPMESEDTGGGGGEVDGANKNPSDPAVSMGYWEGKALGSVLQTFFSWAHAECPQLAMPESVTIVTPQDHLYGVTRILTLATRSNMVVPPPRYVMIADLHASGNLLGLLNADRLLAYLRVRMRNLPTPSALKVHVGDLTCIRWGERGWPIADSEDLTEDDDEEAAAAGGASQQQQQQGRSRRRRRWRASTAVACEFYLRPSTTCLEALHILTAAWIGAGLACLPVAASDGDGSPPTGFLGFINKHDILSTIFAGPLDVALSASVATVMAVRPRPTGCSNQAICFTSESLVVVLDRMFRQKAPCLAVFEKPGAGASWNGQGALGSAVGVITSCDLLQIIVLDAPSFAANAANVEDVFVANPVQRPAHASAGKMRLNSAATVRNGDHRHGDQHGLAKIFHRSKRNSESELPPPPPPLEANNNSNNRGGQRQRSVHKSGSGEEAAANPANQQQLAMDDGTVFEMDECA